MKLREFTSEDKLKYKLKYDIDILFAFNKLTSRYENLIKENESLLKHKTIIEDYKTRVDNLLDELKLLHDFCLESEDDEETRHVATSVKMMFHKLSKIIDDL